MKTGPEKRPKNPWSREGLPAEPKQLVEEMDQVGMRINHIAREAQKQQVIDSKANLTREQKQTLEEARSLIAEATRKILSGEMDDDEMRALQSGIRLTKTLLEGHAREAEIESDDDAGTLHFRKPEGAV